MGMWPLRHWTSLKLNRFQLILCCAERSILKGFLQIAGGSEVNEVNAPSFAKTLGLEVSESRLSAPGDYTDMLELSAAGEGKIVSVGGAFFGVTPRIININSRPVEARP